MLTEYGKDENVKSLAASNDHFQRTYANQQSVAKRKRPQKPISE